MNKFNVLLSILLLVSGCSEQVDMKEMYKANESLFKQLEDPKRLPVWYRFNPTTIKESHTELDSHFLVTIQKVFDETRCNIISIYDGDLIAGILGNSSSLVFTRKRGEEVVELTNYRGSMNDLLTNGKYHTVPYLVTIAPNWYVFFHSTLL